MWVAPDHDCKAGSFGEEANCLEFLDEGGQLPTRRDIDDDRLPEPTHLRQEDQLGIAVSHVQQEVDEIVRLHILCEIPGLHIHHRYRGRENHRSSLLYSSGKGAVSAAK